MFLRSLFVSSAFYSRERGRHHRCHVLINRNLVTQYDKSMIRGKIILLFRTRNPYLVSITLSKQPSKIKKQPLKLKFFF